MHFIAQTTLKYMTQYGHREILSFESKHMLAQWRSDKHIFFQHSCIRGFQNLKCNEKQIHKNLLSTHKLDTTCACSSVEIAHSQKNGKC